MKVFGTGDAPFTAPNGDIAEGNAAELSRPTNQYFNSMYGDAKNLIEASGQSLTTLVADDQTQTAKAVFAHAVRAESVTCSGANAKTLTVRGAMTGAPNTILDGALFTFTANSTTTGAVTIAITGITPAPYPLLWQGAGMSSTIALTAGLAYTVRYNLAGNSFELLTAPQADLIEVIRNTTIDLLYPIGGQPYFSLNSANPATYLGRGTWVAWGGGTHLSMAGTSDGVTLAAGVSGSHTHTLTEAQLPNITGTFQTIADTASTGVFADAFSGNANIEGAPSATYDHVDVTMDFGGGESMPIRPRTTALYGWIRTA